MWELDCEEGWAPKNWCFWTVVLEKTLESPLDCREIQPVHSKGDQPWDFFGRNDARAETPVLWPPHVKSWLIGKDFIAGRDWGQEEKGTTEDEMAGWHHWLDGHESEWTPGDGDRQGGLACCNSWGCKESDTTERLNWTWENKDKVALLQKRNVDPKCKLGTCNPVNFTIFNLRDLKWKKGNQINICINGKGSDSRIVLIFRAFLFHSEFPHTGSSIPLMKRWKVALPLFQPRLKICF